MKLWVILFYITLHLNAAALSSWEVKDPSGFSVKAEDPRSPLSLFDPMQIELEMTYPEDYKPDIQALKQTLRVPYGFRPFPFTLLNESIRPPEKSAEGYLKQTITLELEPRMLGSYALSFDPIVFRSIQASSTHTLSGGTTSITVTLPKDFVAIHKYEPPLLPWPLQLSVDIDAKTRAERLIEEQNPGKFTKENMEQLQKKTLPWKGLVLINFAIAAMLMYMFYPRLFKRRPPQTSPPLSAKMIALQKLDLISDLNTPDSKEDAVFYTHLKEILDTFLVEHYHLPLQSLSVEDILNTPEFQQICIDTQSLWLSNWMLTVEKIKYGKHTPHIHQKTEDINKLKDFINKS